MNKSKIYSEVNSILDSLGEDYISKIPKEIYEVVLTFKDDSYNPKVDIYKSLKNQNISKEAVAMICDFNIRYWCEDSEERNKLKEMLSSDKEKKANKHELIKEINVEEITNETGMIEAKEGIVSKILGWYYNL